MDTLLPGINAERVPTNRLTVNVLSIPDRTGPAVLFVHGNVSSSLFWQPMMLALPDEYRPLAIDLRGFGDTDDEPIDATRGLRDFSDDLAAVVEALGLDRVHLVGWSMGGGVVLQYLTDRPGPVASLTLVDPVSPFGFGGTRGVDGILCDPWGAGSGGGAANPEFVERLAGKDRTDKARCRRGRCCSRTTSSRRTCPSTWTSSWSRCCPPGPVSGGIRVTRARWTTGRASRPATAACSTPWPPPTSGSPTCPE